MRRIVVAALLVSMTVVTAFGYRVYAQQAQVPGNILTADAADPQAQPAPAAAAPVPTQPPGPVHIITFVDITPNNKDAGWAYCKQYAADTRKDPGVTSVELMAQTNRPNHLVIYEVWQNEAAYEKHTTLAHTKDFHAKMVPIIGSPFDERPHYIVP